MKRITTTLLSMIAAFGLMTASAQNQDRKGDKDNQNVFWPMSTDSEKAKESFTEALEHMWNARFEEYKEKMDQTLEADPHFFLANANKAISKYVNSKGKDTEQIDRALALPQDNLTSPEKIVRKVLVNLKENKKEDIKGNVDQMLNEHPDIVQSYEFAMGMSRFIFDDMEMVQKYAKQTSEKFPNHGPAWNELGYYYMEKGNMDKAEEAFNNYLKTDPNEANAHDSYGEFLMKKGKYEEARKHFEKAADMGMAVSKEHAEKARAMAQGSDDE